MVFAPKKNGTLRLSVVLRRLEAIAIRDAYRVLHMDACFQFIGKVKTFLTLVANSRYWQIKLEEGARHKGAFTSYHRLYRLLCMPFGLPNASGTFRRTLDVNVFTVRWKYALVYFDDIVIFSQSHLEYTDCALIVLTTAASRA